MTYQMAAMAVTLNNLEGYSYVVGFFKCNPSIICAAFYKFELSLCSRGPSALAELLVHLYRAFYCHMVLLHHVGPDRRVRRWSAPYLA